MLKRSQDNGQQLDSQLALRYIWFNFRIAGMHPAQKYQNLYCVYAVFINLAFSVALPVALVLQLYNTLNFEELLENLWMTLSTIVCTVKQFVLFLYLNKLRRATFWLQKLDARCNTLKDNRRCILNAIRTCHILYIYVVSYHSIGFILDYISLKNHGLPYNIWFPRIFENPQTNYIVAFMYTCLAQIYVCFKEGNNDMYGLCYLLVMMAHLRALAARIERIGKNHEITKEQNLEELIACIQDHKHIMEYFECIRPVISSTIFFQFLITAVVLCLNAIKLIAFHCDYAQLVFTFAMLLAILCQSFPCCWLAHGVWEETNHLTTAMYSCNWYDQSQEFRRTLLIFMQRSQQGSQMSAGNLVPISVQTFLEIIKFSFSAYTLLSKINMSEETL